MKKLVLVVACALTFSARADVPATVEATGLVAVLSVVLGLGVLMGIPKRVARWVFVAMLFSIPVLSIVLTMLYHRVNWRDVYAREPVPVIGNLRTKIGLYQYDKGCLPGLETETNGTADVKCLCKLLDVDDQDLTGRWLKPNHVQYRVFGGGCKSDDYAYVVGAFGDGNGLAAGMGYAVIEILNPAVGAKFVGTWRRYEHQGDEQIVLCTAGESGVADGSQAKDKNVCWLGDPTGYLSTDAATVQKAIEQLKRAGWDF